MRNLQPPQKIRLVLFRTAARPRGANVVRLRPKREHKRDARRSRAGARANHARERKKELER